MTPNEAARLLAVASAFDNRKPDADSATAWAAALDGQSFDACRDAIVRHYQETEDWLMPSHVLRKVKRERTSRIENAAPIPPANLDPDDTGAYVEWLEVTRRAIADGRPIEQEEYRPTRKIGELSSVLRQMPKQPLPLPAPKTAAHDEAMSKVRAELAARPAIPVPEPLTEDEPAQEAEAIVTECLPDEVTHG